MSRSTNKTKKKISLKPCDWPPAEMEMILNEINSKARSGQRVGIRDIYIKILRLQESSGGFPGRDSLSLLGYGTLPTSPLMADIVCYLIVRPKPHFQRSSCTKEPRSDRTFA
jgi:hypothetical protein